MAGVYPFPEFEDVVHGYLVELYRRFGRPVPALVLLVTMKRDVPDSEWKLGDVKEALDSLVEQELILEKGGGYKPLAFVGALRRQLQVEEVEPFTREYGETPEAHIDKVWDFRTALTKPEAGGKYGLYPTSHYFIEDKRWRGLVQED